MMSIMKESNLDERLLFSMLQALNEIRLKNNEKIRGTEHDFSRGPNAKAHD